MFVDGAKVASGVVDRDRPDVCAMYPGYVDCPKAGFSIDIPPIAWSDPCRHLVRVVAKDADGNEQVLGERVAVPAPS